MLELSNITKIYQGGTVNETCLFDHFALKVPDGQFVCIVGSNGSGKTSLLNIICGSIPIEDGTVRIGGKNVTKMPEYQRHKIIGRVYQDPAKGTCPSMTILENMAMADNKGKPFNRCVNKKQTGRYRDMLAQLGLGLEDKMGIKVGNLSGGQRQAMAMLMTTMTPIEFLILDEHTAALDPKTADLIIFVGGLNKNRRQDCENGPARPRKEVHHPDGHPQPALCSGLWGPAHHDASGAL